MSYLIKLKCSELPSRVDVTSVNLRLVCGVGPNCIWDSLSVYLYASLLLLYFDFIKHLKSFRNVYVIVISCCFRRQLAILLPSWSVYSWCRLVIGLATLVLRERGLELGIGLNAVSLLGLGLTRINHGCVLSHLLFRSLIIILSVCIMVQ